MKRKRFLTVAAAAAVCVAMALACTSTKDNGDGSTVVWVDLGLPSGTLWADRNVGASSPEGYGDHYAWGETKTKKTCTWKNYLHCKGRYDSLTKYCTDANRGHKGFTDDLTTLLPTDDVATHLWGNGAHIPTEDEWLELLDNTTAEEDTAQYGLKGYKLTAANGNSIFLPRAGYCDDILGTGGAGYTGEYWSSSIDDHFKDKPDEAKYLFFDGIHFELSSGERCDGHSVRAVRPAR